MRLINADEFAYDLNKATNGYWIQEQAPVIYKWLNRKVPAFLQKEYQEHFKPVTTKKSLVSGLKPRLYVEGESVKLYAENDFDLQDAQRGLLFYYTGKGYLHPNKPTIFTGLQLSPLIEWLFWVHKNEPKIDLMKVTYEVAHAKLQEFEQKKRAHALLEAARLEKERADLVRRIQEGILHPIRLPLSEDYLLQIFHTEDEFKAEGTAQSNCIHWLMWPKFCRRHTLIGGIRHVSDPNKAWISVELDVQNFSIVQIELEKNQAVSPEEEPVKKLSEFIAANKVLLATIRKEVFDYQDAVIKAKSASTQTDAPREQRFTVRLNPGL